MAWRAGLGAVSARRRLTAAVVPALLHAAPAVTVLPTFLPARAWSALPRALPGGSCCWAGEGHGRGVALTFDDGPSPATEPLLDVLDELGLRATFFLVGEQAAARPRLVAETVARGHEIGTHGMFHRHHLLSSPGVVMRDLSRSLDAIEAAGAPRPRLFRPPYGQLAAATVVASRGLGLQTVLWTRWGREFVPGPAAAVLARLEAALRPGSILLLHDSDAYSAPGTAMRSRAVLPLLAAGLARRSLRAVVAGELVGAVSPGASRPAAATQR